MTTVGVRLALVTVLDGGGRQGRKRSGAGIRSSSAQECRDFMSVYKLRWKRQRARNSQVVGGLTVPSQRESQDPTAAGAG